MPFFHVWGLIRTKRARTGCGIRLRTTSVASALAWKTCRQKGTFRSATFGVCLQNWSSVRIMGDSPILLSHTSMSCIQRCAKVISLLFPSNEPDFVFFFKCSWAKVLRLPEGHWLLFTHFQSRPFAWSNFREMLFCLFFKLLNPDLWIIDTWKCRLFQGMNKKRQCSKELVLSRIFRHTTRAISRARWRLFCDLLLHFSHRCWRSW